MERRTALGLMGSAAIGASATGLIGSAPAKAQMMNLDPSNPEDVHYMHRKLCFSHDDRLSYWYIRAVRYGLMDGIFTPFWNMHVGMVFNTEDISEHRYRSKSLIKIFYSDIESGELIKKFDNPYTGKTVDVVQPGLAKPERIFGLNGGGRSSSPAGEIGDDGKERGATIRNNDIGPAWVIGDDIWLNADMLYRSETPNALGRLIQVNDWETFHGSMTEVADPNLTSAAATHTFNDINTFNSSWYEMEGINAQSVSRGFGRKSHSLSDMPSTWLNFMEEAHPELLDNIDGAFKK